MVMVVAIWKCEDRTKMMQRMKQDTNSEILLLIF